MFVNFAPSSTNSNRCWLTPNQLRPRVVDSGLTLTKISHKLADPGLKWSKSGHLGSTSAGINPCCPEANS